MCSPRFSFKFFVFFNIIKFAIALKNLKGGGEKWNVKG